jgi:ferredoxin
LLIAENFHTTSITIDILQQQIVHVGENFCFVINLCGQVLFAVTSLGLNNSKKLCVVCGVRGGVWCGVVGRWCECVYVCSVKAISIITVWPY